MTVEPFSGAFKDKIEVAGTITKLPASAAGKVIISGSHGGELPGGMALRAGARAVILNDAGVGFENAGIGSLAFGQKFGMAAATVDCMSCRIGDADDMVAQGVISHANALALSAGVDIGQSCQEAAQVLTTVPLPDISGGVPEFSEHREMIQREGFLRNLVLLDSASMVIPEDEGQVVLTGSHGGIIGGNPKYAIKAPVYAAFFSDAGGGCEDWGFTRLPALDDQDIAAATLDCMSFRIGDARSGLATGIISRVNKKARALDVEVGMAAGTAVERLCR